MRATLEKERPIRFFTPAHCRSARAWLNWTQNDLATNAGVANSTVADFEREARMTSTDILMAMRTALEAAGIVFLPDGIVRQPGSSRNSTPK